MNQEKRIYDFLKYYKDYILLIKANILMIVLLKVEIVRMKNIISFKLELGRTSHALPLLVNSHLQQDVFLLFLQQEGLSPGPETTQPLKSHNTSNSHFPPMDSIYNIPSDALIPSIKKKKICLLCSLNLFMVYH